MQSCILDRKIARLSRWIEKGSLWSFSFGLVCAALKRSKKSIVLFAALAIFTDQAHFCFSPASRLFPRLCAAFKHNSLREK